MAKKTICFNLKGCYNTSLVILLIIFFEVQAWQELLFLKLTGRLKSTPAGLL